MNEKDYVITADDIRCSENFYESDFAGILSKDYIDEFEEDAVDFVCETKSIKVVLDRADMRTVIYEAACKGTVCALRRILRRIVQDKKNGYTVNESKVDEFYDFYTIEHPRGRHCTRRTVNWNKLAETSPALMVILTKIYVKIADTVTASQKNMLAANNLCRECRVRSIFEALVNKEIVFGAASVDNVWFSLKKDGSKRFILEDISKPDLLSDDMLAEKIFDVLINSEEDINEFYDGLGIYSDCADVCSDLREVSRDIYSSLL